MTVAAYELYAIKYAHHDRLRSANFIGGDPHDGPMPMDYFVWLARSAERTFVIDTGFNAEAAARRKRDLVRCPTEGLAMLDVDAAKVRDVIITHLHYDHVGNFDLFPAATFHLQDREMQFATGRHMRSDFLRHSFDVENVIGDGEGGLQGAGRVPRRRRRDRARNLGAPRRRPHDGPAVRPRPHPARLGCRRLRREPLLREHARAAAVHDGVQRRRHDPGLGPPARARRFARPRRPGSRPGGAAALPAAAPGPGRASRCASTSHRPPDAEAAAEDSWQAARSVSSGSA